MLRGKGIGGASGGTGGNILRTVTGAVARARVQEPFSSAATRPSSPTSRPAHQQSPSGFHGLSANSPAPFPGQNQSRPGIAGGEEYVFGSEEEKEFGGWTVPSEEEVRTAVSELHRVFGPISCSLAQSVKDNGSEPDPDEDILGRVIKPEEHGASFGSDVDWVEPCLEFRVQDPKIQQVDGIERVYDAFHLLENDPSIQRMVMSISSDRAVWAAILNNEVVQHLRNSLSQGKEDNFKESCDDIPSGDTTNVICWMFSNTKMKIVEIIERMVSLIKYLLLQNDTVGKTTKARVGGDDGFEEKLKTSFFISIVVLLVVVVSRACKA